MFNLSKTGSFYRLVRSPFLQLAFARSLESAERENHARPNRETELARDLAVGERESKVLVGRVRLHVVRDDADLEGLDVGDDVGVGRRLEHAVQAATAESEREIEIRCVARDRSIDFAKESSNSIEEEPQERVVSPFWV